MNSDKSTKSLVNAAVFSAITVVMYAVSSYIPLLNVIILFAAHLPLVVVYSKHGFKYALFSGLVSSALILFILGPGYAVTFLFTSLVIGMVLGYYSKKEESSMVIIGVLSIFTLLSIGILFKVTTLMTGVDMITVNIDSVIKSTETSLATLKAAGMGEMAPKINMQDFRTYLLIAVPGMALVSTGILSWINYIITQKSLKRFNVKLSPIKEFSMWYIPAKIAYPVMLLMLGNMFLGSEELTPTGYAIQTIFIMVFTVNALATISYYLKKAKIPKPLIAVILVGIFLMIQSILLFVGLIEYALNIRRLDKKRASIITNK